MVFSLSLDDIKVIGIRNQMNGDEDTDYVVLVNAAAEVYIMLICPEVADGIEELLRTRFRIEWEVASKGLLDQDVVIYPNTLAGQGLFDRDSLGMRVKKLIGRIHAAGGELTPAVKEFLKQQSY